MGLYDRDYYHDEDDSAAPFFSPRRGDQKMMVTYIIIVTVVLWVLDNLTTRPWLSEYLVLQSDLFEHPQHFYQLATYALTHSPLKDGGLLHIFFNMLMLWMFGRELEWKYGRTEFLRFYVAAAVVAGLVWLGVKAATGQPALLSGASGATAAVLFLFIVNYPKRTLHLWGVLGMPAWVLGVAYVVGELFFFFNPGKDPIAYEAHLAGAAFGAAYYQFGWSFQRLRIGAWRGWMDRFKTRPKLKVHDPETYYRDLDAEADALLTKIHKYGENALTNEERKKLEDYSRRMRQKHR
jgi:membrane associated rhomboid family serine protease